MLLDLERKKKNKGEGEEEEDQEELESTFFLRSQPSEVHDPGDSSSDTCKDVNVVSVLSELSASSGADPLRSAVVNDRILKNHSLLNSRIRYQDDSASLDSDSGNDTLSVSSPSIFEFQKGERALQRVPLSPFSKPAPSKWDDAQKWIASPNSNRPKMAQSQMHIGQPVGTRKPGSLDYGGWQLTTKVLVEVPDQSLVAFGEPDTKRIDLTQAKKESGEHKFVTWENDSRLAADSYGKPVLMIENSGGEASISLSQHDSSVCINSATAFVPPPSTARSVSMRDMGTEMTPIASQEPSRTGTPVRETMPIRSSSPSSRPSSPGRNAPASSMLDSTNEHLDSEKEIQQNTRREIMVLGKQLGKTNIAAWASKEAENDASTSLRTVAAEQPAKDLIEKRAAEQPTKDLIEKRAAAWEEAEKAKYMARFKQEEMKIGAWENHQKAKAEAEMRKTEVEVERIRGQAHDRLMNKLAAVRHKAEEKKAAAESKRNQQAVKTEQQAEYIRSTGRIPRSFSCCNWCL